MKKQQEELQKAAVHHDRLLIGITASRESAEYSVSISVDLHQFPAGLLGATHQLHAGKRKVADLPYPVDEEAPRRGGVGAAAQPPRLVEERRGGEVRC